jgi:hypothetical protein
MKKLALLLLLIPLAFAAWQATAALAILTSAIMLAILFMIGMGFGINELQLTAKEELFQVIAVAIMMVVLVGSDSVLNTISNNVAFSGGGTNMQDGAMMIVNDTAKNVSDLFNTIRDTDHKIAQEASKGGSCNVIQVGYSVSACGGYSMLPTPMSMAGSIAGFAVGELAAMYRLLEISTQFAMSFLLPLGIILRTFKLTRGAGGFLIALGVSMYILLPMGIIFNEMMAVTFLAAGSSGPDAANVALYNPVTTAPSIPSCNSLDTGSFLSGFDSPLSCGSSSSGWKDAFLGGSNDGNAVGAYCALRGDIKGYLYLMLAKATLGPVIALLMMMAGIRTLSSIAGAEVDVSAISRFV